MAPVADPVYVLSTRGERVHVAGEESGRTLCGIETRAPRRMRLWRRAPREARRALCGNCRRVRAAMRATSTQIRRLSAAGDRYARAHGLTKEEARAHERARARERFGVPHLRLLTRWQASALIRELEEAARVRGGHVAASEAQG